MVRLELIIIAIDVVFCPIVSTNALELIKISVSSFAWRTLFRYLTVASSTEAVPYLAVFTQACPASRLRALTYRGHLREPKIYVAASVRRCRTVSVSDERQDSAVFPTIRDIDFAAAIIRKFVRETRVSWKLLAKDEYKSSQCNRDDGADRLRIW